jgi:parallel beta-helix repeat protein/predicted outer membrane repeat protein
MFCPYEKYSNKTKRGSKDMKSFIYVCQFSIILLSNSFAQIHISGALSGVLEDTTYIVDNNIWVAVGDSLVIEAGVVLLFSYNRDFDIYGYLSAIGEVDDSIYFRPNAGVSQWGSLDFNANCSDSSQISYVYFTGAYGSAINLYDTDISISHCTFRDNQATFGGAIYCSSANPYINICVLDSNSAALTGGGGIYMTQGSQPIISDCIIHNNFGGGIYAADTSCFISQGNTITNNTGGGITCSNSYGTII